MANLRLVRAVRDAQKPRAQIGSCELPKVIRG
jgi:hypothetical protein